MKEREIREKQNTEPTVGSLGQEKEGGKETLLEMVLYEALTKRAAGALP